MDIYLKKLSRKRAYRRLFLNEDGQLRPEALTVLEDLYNHTRLFKNVSADPQALVVVEGGRQVVRHIIKQVNIEDSEMKRRIKQGVFEGE